MELEQWKQKYYDQLDLMEKREQDWEALESTLKRTISRLSLAAEGQNSTLDRHISDLRGSIKNSINPQQLESIVDDISRVLSQLEDKQDAPDRESITALEQLLTGLQLPANVDKIRKKLLKKFTRSDDSAYAHLLKDSLDLINSILQTDTPESEKSGLLDRLFHTDKSSADKPVANDVDLERQQLEMYKSCLLDLLNKLDDPRSPSGKLTALKISAQDAQQKEELDKLSDTLSDLLSQSTDFTVHASQAPSPAFSEPDSTLQPSIQELLIRLLEQLIIPADLQDDADKMKRRLEQETSPANWKSLLKNVASLINSIRSRMQKEKHEFEDFLQQVTDRLKAMDQFLQLETSNLNDAQSQGKEFDQQVSQNVKDIRYDISQATELSSLKQNVNSKLDIISGHIKLYRESENKRIQQSQQEVDSMHAKMQLLETESDQLKKVVIEKNRLAMFDTLTGIPNRLSYENKIEEEIARWKRFKNPLSLAIWDIDYFKKVNDCYGHKAGDKVLKTVAQLLYKRIRTTDFLARYGGEEFVMLLPGTVQEETLRLVNDLRQQIEDCGFHYHGEAVQITISCGVSSFNEADNLNQVFDRADQALYKAKANGRNQCVVASCLS